MRVSASAAAAALALSTGALAQNSSSTTCSPSLHLIVARGSTEAPGLGHIGVVARNASAAIPGSTIDAVDWPATLTEYAISERQGVDALTAQLAAYVGRCPDSKVALVGYSQGGHVIMDALCGTTEEFFNVTAAFGNKYQKNIVAVVTYGDPSHVTDVPWNAGTSKKNGIFPRKDTAACAPYGSTIRAWCDTGDVYCDSGNVTGIHGTYFQKYTQDAAKFIVEKYNASLEAGSSGTGSNATTTTASRPGATVTPTSSSSPVPGNAGAVARPGMVAASAALFLAVFLGAAL